MAGTLVSVSFFKRSSRRALNYLLALVMLGLVPTAGVSVTVSGFVGAKGSVGTMMSGRHCPVQQQACASDCWVCKTILNPVTFTVACDPRCKLEREGSSRSGV